MKQLSKIKKLNLRDIWAKESSDFTPWLAEHITELGEALGMELELEEQEASVGDFSLDLLAKDVGGARVVVIENQLTKTDHDHLGKLLTYASGRKASVVVWVAEEIRDEHRKALEWLNERTDSKTDFFGMVVEVIQIDDSQPAFNFLPVVMPNEWEKTQRSKAVRGGSERGESYRAYFQPLIDELREKHKFTGARVAQPQGWYAFSSGVSGFHVNAVFAGKNTVRVELYIDCGDRDENKSLFDFLFDNKNSVEKECGFPLIWERLDGKRASRVYINRSGSIESNVEELDEIRKWQIEKLLIFKKVFAPLIRAGVKK